MKVAETGDEHIFAALSTVLAGYDHSSPRAHLQVVGNVVAYVKDINRLSLPTPFYSVLVSVFTAHSTVFHFIHSPDNSLLPHSVLSVLILPFNYVSLYESLFQPSCMANLRVLPSLPPLPLPPPHTHTAPRRPPSPNCVLDCRKSWCECSII